MINLHGILIAFRFFIFLLQDDSFFDYLNTLSPLNTKKYVGVGATMTLNSLGMAYPLFTSLDVTFNDESIFLTRYL
jgi:hypothetical protein